MNLPVSPLAPTPLPLAMPVPGVVFHTANTGLKYQGRDDLFLATFARGTVGAGSFTQNQVVGAPVQWTRDQAQATAPRALIVNAGNANVANGAAGLATCHTLAHELAPLTGLAPAEIWQASTGVIGEALAPEPLVAAAATAIKAGERGPEAAAQACLTTDTFPKMASRSLVIDGQTLTLSGFAKGSGMVQPNMATMLAFVFTDAAIDAHVLQRLHQAAVNSTLNAITVDSDTSTSDMALTFATGQGPQVRDDCDEAAFGEALAHIYRDLAHLVVRDGEGASKFIEVTVRGAQNTAEAKTLAFAVANSPLVKTAIAGEDANWGRLLMALGKAGVSFDPAQIQVSIGGIPIVDSGARVPGYDEAPVAAHLKGQDITLDLSVGKGPGSFQVWTCDLTHGYVSINADYRS